MIIRKPVIGVEYVIAKIFERSAMKGVGTGLREHRNLRTWAPSEFRSEGRGLNAELLECIERDQIAHTAQCASSRELTRPALAKAGSGSSQIRAHAIYHEVIRIGPLTVHTELSLLIVGGSRSQHNAWRKLQQ